MHVGKHSHVRTNTVHSTGKYIQYMLTVLQTLCSPTVHSIPSRYTIISLFYHNRSYRTEGIPSSFLYQSQLNLIKVQDVEMVSKLPDIIGDEDKLEDGWNAIDEEQQQHSYNFFYTFKNPTLNALPYIRKSWKYFFILFFTFFTFL